MVKIKYDVSDSDPTRASAGPRELAPTGIHGARLIECNYREPGKDKAEGKDPDLECIYEFEDNYAPVWDYVGLGERAKWKLDQFLQAMGVASEDRRKGEFDTKDLISRKVQLRITRGQDLEGNYRPNVGGVYMPEDGERLGPTVPEDTWDDEDDEDADEDGPLFSNEEIAEANGKRLREMVKEAQEAGYDINVPSGSKVGDVRNLLIDAMADGSGDEDDEDDLDDLDEDEDDVPF